MVRNCILGIALLLCAGVPALTVVAAFSSTAARYGTAKASKATTVTRRPAMVLEEELEMEVASSTVRLPSQGTRVRLFYPTTAAAAAKAAAAAAGEKGEEGGGMAYAPYGTDGRSLGLAFVLAPASSGCVEDAPLLAADAGIDIDIDIDACILDANDDNSTKFPLLIYSHGVGGNMDAATCLFRTLASKNVIVAAVEHTDGTASSTMRQDGSELPFTSQLMTERRQLAWRASELLEAVEYLPTELDRWGKCDNNDNDAGEAGGAGSVVGPVILGGRGFGATSAVMAANGAATNSTVCGLILHDPTLGMGYGILPPNKAYNRLPAVTYVSDKYHKAQVQYGARTLHVRGGRHKHFEDALLWGAPRWARSVDPFEIHEQLAESMSTFLRTRDATSAAVAKGSLLEVVR